MFHPDRCDGCGICLTTCQWMNVRQDEAENWFKAMMNGERTPAVDRCITCYACNERCPQGANPFDLIAALQETYEVVARAGIAAQEQRYVFEGDLNPIPKVDRIMTTCVFGKSDGHLIQGELYELPRIGGKPYFCWVLFSHMGAESVQRRHAAEFVRRLAQTGAREVVCFHDDCYAMLAKLAPEYGIPVPFRPVHLSEYLVTYLKSQTRRLKPLDIRVAYQRPCASRHTPEKEAFIDELFRLVGVTRVARTYDRENALCCAGAKFLMGQGDPAPDQEKNIQDAVNAGAQALAALCPMCMHTLAGAAATRQLPIVFIGDLARMALGEIPKPALASQPSNPDRR
ncbi:MAG: (Fe-S)-binding protein [Thermodesulfobacteriota bacterium]